MKKVISNCNITVSPGNYFIEDILYIHELLHSVSERVVISTDKDEFESIEELKEYKGPIKEMSIVAHDPFISVKISDWVTIYSMQDTSLTRGISEKIADLAKERVTLFDAKSRVASYSLYVLSALTSVAMSYFFYVDYKPIVAIGIINCGILFLICFSYVRKRQRSSIKLIPKHEAPNFFKANLDKIVIAVIAATVGAIVGRIIR